MKPILVLGLGNLLQCDDGVGCRVAQELEQIVIASREAAKQSPNPNSEIASSQNPLLAMTKPYDNVEVIDGGTPGVGLLNLFEGCTRVIIIDAAEMGIAPGEFKRFGTEEVLLTGSAKRISLHRTGIADALALAHELKMKLPEIVFFGVQPALIDWKDGLSPQVQAAMPRVIEAVLNELK